MKTKIQSLRSFQLLAVIAALLVSASAYAQGDFTFSGGSGTPISLTLAQPITYVITIATDMGPVILFQNVGNFASDHPAVFGDITYSINGGEPQQLSSLNSGFTGGSFADDTMYLYGPWSGLAIGDTIIVNAGTLSTFANIDGAVPSDGSFGTLLVDPNTNGQISTDGISVVPEPKTWVMLLGGLGLLGCVQHFRRVGKA